MTANKAKALTDEIKQIYTLTTRPGKSAADTFWASAAFLHKKEATKSDFFWRRKRDLNPRAGFPTYSLSRGAPSPLGYFCMAN